jgi:glc operon protein GlcG
MAHRYHQTERWLIPAATSSTFERMAGAMLASIQIAEHKERAAATFRRETKQFEVGIQLMHLNYLLAFGGIVASRGSIPLTEQGVIIGAINSSGDTDLRGA